MRGVSIVNLQFGRANLDSSGTGPILINIPDYGYPERVSLTATAESSVAMSYYEVSSPLFAIASTIPATTTFDYIIASSR
jgi:hypothetical protein